jgi:hypothetical protein
MPSPADPDPQPEPDTEPEEPEGDVDDLPRPAHLESQSKTDRGSRL